MNNLFALDSSGQEAQAQQRMAIQPNAIRAVVDVEQYSAAVEQPFATRKQAVAAQQNRSTLEQHNGDASLTFAPLSWPDFTEVNRHLAEPEHTVIKRGSHEYRGSHEHCLGFYAILQENLTDAVVSTDLDFRMESWNCMKLSTFRPSILFIASTRFNRAGTLAPAPGVS